MLHCWRWFGPDDPVSLAEIRQTGAVSVVTALHQQANDTVWPREEIRARRAAIEAAGLCWNVVESIPVHEDIKTGAVGWQDKADVWATTAENLAAEGVSTICYNFMPVLDWTRTDVDHRLPDGASCLRFDAADLAVFDLHLLGRAGAAESHQAEIVERAEARNAAMDAAERARLTSTILAGLPGSEESYTLDEFRAQLARYNGIGPRDLRANLAAFLARVMPRIERAGLRIAIHPDDPPRPIFGLPRVVSTAEDMRAICGMWLGVANGFTFCTGSLGVRHDNDLPAMLAEFRERVHFLHLRATRREADGQSFYEADHLDGDVDMVAVIKEVRAIEAVRGEALPMRPDHGHAMLSDLGTGFRPGYPAIGRLRGLAELRGVERALAWMAAREVMKQQS
ncbi:mannonate dehydratase [Oricola cellulosilytica]|uniref:Mannonate dehydratase n=1 Tax=Oricola cellulosilytica TaxID=1429082 RepID=A0A4R0P8H0_9HYPH|nr:mannonate dehydratase [Oricola cellulosilytica]TCD13364.1 mannonate dehydratase [Oricola cellulosilytica]